MTTISDEQHISDQIDNFKASLCPFGWLDMQAAIKVLEDTLQEGEYSADILSDELQEYMSSTDTRDFGGIDITAIAYEYILNKAREELFEITTDETDLMDYIWVAGNYMATSFD